jgi:hypothetical protein
VKAAALRRTVWRDPRVVVWAYAFVIALAVAVQALVPGYPNYGEDQSMLGSALIIDGAILIGLLRGSKVAWGFAVFFSGVAVGLWFLLGFDSDGGLKFLLLGVLELLALLLLLSRAMDAHVWNRPPRYGGSGVLIFRESSRR